MLVKKLRMILEQCPDNYIVILSNDAEGNSYSPLAEVDVVMYVPENTYQGDIVEDQEEIEEEYKENAVALWPVN